MTAMMGMVKLDLAAPEKGLRRRLDVAIGAPDQAAIAARSPNRRPGCRNIYSGTDFRRFTLLDIESLDFLICRASRRGTICPLRMP